jgi:hypothetical protein
MRALSASELLNAWERGLGAGPIRRALELLGAAFPEREPDTLAGLTIGQRDALLMRLRQATFGPRLTGMAACGRCGAHIEISADTEDLLAGDPAGETAVALEGYELLLRPATSRDLAAASHPDLMHAKRQLLERCLISARRAGAAVRAFELPDSAVEAAGRQLAVADPNSEIRLNVGCPECGTRHRLTFDIVSFFWHEIECWAMRLIREVHVLASAYGWREEEILALSPARRQCYLDLVGA